ncbi:hypothetical protein IL306_008849 [Fusarium sp. DS 682]|nr:hypothetical protein IL306_008849 [Fusarium sp. DS 682]
MNEFAKHLRSHLPGTSRCSCLYIRGAAGSGKSVLAANTIQQLQEKGDIVLFFFFRQSVEKNHSAKYLVRDFAAQLLPHCPALMTSLVALSQKHAIQDSEMELIWSALVDALVNRETSERIFCVVDTLDEMDSGDFDDMVDRLVALGTAKPDKIRAMMSTKPVPEILQALRNPSVGQLKLDLTLLSPDVTHRLPRGLRGLYEDALTDHARRSGITAEQQAKILMCVIYVDLAQGKNLVRTGCGRLLEVLETSLSLQVQAEHPLAEYAAENLSLHLDKACMAGPADYVLDALNRFFVSGKPALENWGLFMNLTDLIPASDSIFHLAAAVKFAQSLPVFVLEHFAASWPKSLDAPDHDGRTPLSYGTASGQVEIARFLLAKGANPGSVGKDGRTSLHWAVDWQPAIVQMLIDAGADPLLKRGPIHEAYNDSLMEQEVDP